MRQGAAEVICHTRFAVTDPAQREKISRPPQMFRVLRVRVGQCRRHTLSQREHRARLVTLLLGGRRP